MTWKRGQAKTGGGRASRVASPSPVVGSVYQEFDLMQFRGLNNKYAPMHISDQESPDLMNVVFDELGAITKRNGYTAVNGVIDDNPITTLIPYYKSDGTKKLLVVAGTNIYDATPADLMPATWNEYVNDKWQFLTLKTWANVQSNFPIIHSGLNANGNRFSFATYYDVLYMVNGNAQDGLMTWDGTTFGKVSGAPAGQYVVLHKNRLYIAGDPQNPSSLYMSDLGIPTSWPALNVINVNQNDGDKITGLAEQMDSLVIFKGNSISVLRGTGLNNYTLVDTHQSVGTVSHWSVVPVMTKERQVLLFLARNGVYEFDGRGATLISDPISGSVLGINNLPSWNQTYLNDACAANYNNKYWLSVPEGQTFRNNRIYVYDYIHGIWTRFDIQASALSTFDTGTGIQLFSGDVSESIVYQQDVGGDDNGSPISAWFTTKAFDFGAPAHFKSYKDFLFFARQQLNQYSINVSYIGDFGKITKTVPMQLGAGNSTQWGNAVWGQNVWGSSADVATRSTSISGQTRYMQFKVQGTGAEQPFVFYGWAIRYNVKGRMR